MLRDYLAYFNEATIKTVPMNQEMFVGEFENRLKECHFNESLALKLALTLTEVIARVECYIKGKENNAEKKAHNIK